MAKQFVSYRSFSYVTLADLAQHPEQLPMIRAAAGHPDIVPGVMSEEQAEVALQRIKAKNGGRLLLPGRAASVTVYARGKTMRHKPSGRKVTIIRASAGKKNGEEQHEVVCVKTGKKFLAKESNLKPCS